MNIAVGIVFIVLGILLIIFPKQMMKFNLRYIFRNKKHTSLHVARAIFGGVILIIFGIIFIFNPNIFEIIINRD